MRNIFFPINERENKKPAAGSSSSSISMQSSAQNWNFSGIGYPYERGETIRVYTAGMTASQTTTFRTEEGKEVH